MRDDMIRKKGFHAKDEFGESVRKAPNSRGRRWKGDWPERRSWSSQKLSTSTSDYQRYSNRIWAILIERIGCYFRYPWYLDQSVVLVLLAEQPSLRVDWRSSPVLWWWILLTRLQLTFVANMHPVSGKRWEKNNLSHWRGKRKAVHPTELSCASCICIYPCGPPESVGFEFLLMSRARYSFCWYPSWVDFPLPLESYTDRFTAEATPDCWAA